VRRLPLLLGLAVPLLARAQVRGSEDVVAITPTAVSVRLDGMTAVFSAQFAFTARYGENQLTFERPDDAAITKATVTAPDGTVHPLALALAEKANQRFEDTQGAPVTKAAKQAIAMVSEAGVIDLLAPRAGRMTATMEYVAPTCFHRDVRYVGVPASWRALIPQAQRGQPPAGACVANFEEPPKTWVALASRDLVTGASGDGRIGVTVGRLAVGDTHFARVELDLSAVLADIPRDLATAIVIDRSSSMTGEELDTQRLLVESYVRAAGQTRVQVIGYARRATPVLPSWTLASIALPRLDRELRALAGKNGSNLDAGLVEAALWLGRVEGTKRVVLVTDERFPERVAALEPERLAKLLPPNTLVHVVTIAGGADALSRNPEGALAELATSTKGLAVFGGASEETPLAAALLVRPITLDDVTVNAPGWQHQDQLEACQLHDELESLPQGDSCTWWFRGTPYSGPIVVEGKLWEAKVTRTLRPDPARGTALARELLGHVTMFDDEELVAAIQDAARAVSSRWALFAAWGGTSGYDHAVGGFGFGTSGGGSCCGDIGIGSVGSFGTGMAHLDVSLQLRNALRACHAERHRVDVTLETTLSEIVGVDVRAQDPAVAGCVTEAIWDIALMIQNPPAHRTVELVVGPL